MSPKQERKGAQTMNYMVERHGSRAERGMTLLEVVIAVAILTSLALSSTLIFIPVSRQARVNREISVANNEAKRVMEKVQAVPFKDVTRIYPNGRVIVIGVLPNGTITTTYSDPAADPLVLRAVLSWDSPDLGTMTREFYTVRTE
jgi:prepilin-type N-terminal cleavage/methylation domain-containing protein